MASVSAVAILSVAMLLLWQVVESSYDPIYGRSSSVFYNASTVSYRYPDLQHIVEGNYKYFISDLNFDAVSGRVLSGAADNLYVLDYELQEVQSYTWEPEQSKMTSCENSNQDTTDYTCRNHIRIYQKMPTLPDTSLLVCGTQATEEPQCRVVQVSNEGSTLTPSSTVDASPGIVSYYPGFSQLGEFRQQDTEDTTYISAGFFQGDNGVGRHFSISYQNISATDPNTLTTTERFSTIEGDNTWLRFPVTFVDMLRLDYAVVSPADHDYEYQFYFVFLRENEYSATTSSDDLIQSRVARICRNDRGLTDGSDPYFNSYMKARIFCQRQLDTGDEFDGAINYLYNELRSIAFTMGGRYYDNGAYGKMLYGAFTTPINGPRGTAICAYSAENSAEHDGNGLSQSMFDIFRADLVTPDGGEAENNLVECRAEGRSVGEAQNILVHDKQVKQLGNDPLLVLDGVLVSQMALDQQCVIKRGDDSSCLNQDVLFLGTDSGKILKVVFANRGSEMSTVFPVVTEEIVLDDENNIEKMTIHEVDGSKYLFVNTFSKLYRFSLERCSRHESCLDCIGSRDPYCVWDANMNQCVSNPFEVTGNGDQTVDSSRYKQDIHRGEDEDITGCSSEPDCMLITSAPDYSSLQFEVACTNTQSNEVSVTVPQWLIAADTTLTLDSSGRASTTISNATGFQSYTISIRVDGTTFTSTVITPPGPPFSLSASEILVDSITATSLRVTLNIDSFTDYFTEYQFRVVGDGLTTSYQSLSTSNSLTITNLSPATDYSYSIEVQNSVGSATSSMYDVRTLDDVPTAVRNLVATPTNTSITLQWDEPQTTNGAITGYSITIVEGSEVMGCAGFPDATVTSYEVTGLVPFNSYHYSVAACTSAGEGPGQTVTAMTLCGTPERVTDLQFPAESITANSMVYTWSQPAVVNGDPDELQYNTSSVCFNESGITPPMTTTDQFTQRTINDLSPLTYCCVTVTPINRCQGQSEIPGLVSWLCAQSSDIVPGEVRNLNVTGINQEGLLVTWEPPDNYQRVGLTYNISVTSAGGFSGSYTTYDDTNIYVDGLKSSTEYTVSVAAVSDEGTGASETDMDLTLPSPPPSPSDPHLEVVDDMAVTLRLSWSHPNAALYQITEYEAVMRCNEQELPLQTTSDMSVDFDVTNPGSDFAWCTAQVLARNDVGRSPFSTLASIAIPSQRPSTPRCYLVDDQGSSVTVSFDVTHPFSLDELEIRYKLLADDQTPADVSETIIPFNALTSNVVVVDVNRNTEYNFPLRICNRHGCSEYCQQLRNFTTSSTAPRPPSSIVVSDITYNSASFSWDVPAFENASHINYTVQVSGSGVGSDLLILPGNETSTNYFRGRLDPQTMYIVAIQVTDTRMGAMGTFGGVTNFTTLSGTPSEPRDLDVKWDGLDEILTATWAVPNYPNGTLTRYEVYYSGSATEDCGKEDIGEKYVSVNVSTRELKTTETKNVVDGRSVLLCVRAYTDKPGTWAFSILKKITIVSLGDDQVGEEPNCNGLIAVAVVAGLAVLSTLVAGIVLCVVVRRSNQVMDEDPKSEEAGISDCPSSPSRFKDKIARSASQYSAGDSNPCFGGSRTSPAPSPSEQSCDTGYGGGLSSRPYLASNPSIDSTRSTAPLMRHNGSSR